MKASADPDYYEILEVDPSASAEEITASYRRLVWEFHPDHRPDGEEHTKLLTRAYSILSDPEARRKYDRGRTRPSGFEGGASAKAATARPRPRPSTIDFGTLRPGEASDPIRVSVCSEGGWPLGEPGPPRDAGAFWRIRASGIPDGVEIPYANPDELYFLDIVAAIPSSMSSGPHKDSLTFRWGDEEGTLHLSVEVAAKEPTRSTFMTGTMPSATRPSAPRPRARRISGAIVAVVVLGFVLARIIDGVASQPNPSTTSVPSSAAATTPSFSAPIGNWTRLSAKAPFTTGGSFGRLSCSADGFCLATNSDSVFGASNEVETYLDGTWTALQNPPVIADLSCASRSFCLGLGYPSEIYSHGSWTQTGPKDDNAGLLSFNDAACPVNGFCFVTYSGPANGVYTYSNGLWEARFALSYAPVDISCPSIHFCMADAGLDGQLFTYQSGSWTRTYSNDNSPIDEVSCASPSLCIGLGAGNGGTRTPYVMGGNGQWSMQSLPNDNGPVYADSVVCPPGAPFCLARSGPNAYTFSDGMWSEPVPLAPTSDFLTNIACGSRSFCLALDDSGNTYTFSG